MHTDVLDRFMICTYLLSYRGIILYHIVTDINYTTSWISMEVFCNLYTPTFVKCLKSFFLLLVLKEMITLSQSF